MASEREEQVSELIRKLCKELDMEFVLDEDNDYAVAEDKCDDRSGGYIVWRNGKPYDDRAAEFIALRSLIVTLFGTAEYRNDPYIFNFTDWSLVSGAQRYENLLDGVRRLYHEYC